MLQTESYYAHDDTRLELKELRETFVSFEQRHISDVRTLQAEINILKNTVVSEIRDLKQALIILIEQKQNHSSEPSSCEIQKTSDSVIVVGSTH